MAFQETFDLWTDREKMCLPPFTMFEIQAKKSHFTIKN